MEVVLFFSHCLGSSKWMPIQDVEMFPHFVVSIGRCLRCHSSQAKFSISLFIVVNLLYPEQKYVILDMMAEIVVFEE